jgi:hypothetical protein
MVRWHGREADLIGTRLRMVPTAAVILRLPDRPGLAVAPVAGEPRKSAAELLGRQFRAGQATGVLSTIGPAAAPLLDAVLARVDRLKADPLFEGNVEQHAVLLGQMGPRASRASRSLFEFAALLAARGKQSVEYHLPRSSGCWGRSVRLALS